MENLTGQVIKGYELYELIGEGGYGAVYRATQQVVGREVAVKIILAQYANQPEFIRRFEAEAQLIARLEHLHIVPLYDYWREPSGAYLVMRWLKSGTLRQSIREKGAWSLRASARLLGQIGSALAVAHQNGIIHRDVKPANILLDEDHNAYLSDFGIAVTVTDTQSPAPGRMLMGSAGYISPEQVNMLPVGTQADIYSLGIVMYELLTGKHPYADAQTSMALFIKHTSDPLPPMLDFPPNIEAVLQKATAKEPEDRYTDLQSFAAAFKRVVMEEDDKGFKGLPGSFMGAEAPFAELELSDSYELTPLPSLEIIQNPYKGLQAFQEGDAENFFGREKLVEQLLDRVAEDHPLNRFLAVVGPSGSGKSSVVKAGVIPSLRRGAMPGSHNWFILEMLPGPQPFEELAATLLKIAIDQPENLVNELKSSPRALNHAVKTLLPDPNSQLVLMIDQFEEVFTQLEDDRARTLFLDSLYYAVTSPDSQLRLIVTLRADFYDRPLMFPGISELMQQRTVVVVPLTREELERTIIAPARRVRVGFEQGLAAAIVNEVHDQPGVLPMLQYALTELFEQRQNSLLTHIAYKEIGGVLGALARRADEIFEDFDPDRQESTRQLFLRLVTLGEGKEDTRRRALQSEIMAAAFNVRVMQSVIDSFSKYRLLTLDRDPLTRTPTVEVAHEALIREWLRLREWLDNSRLDVRHQRVLATNAKEWRDSNHDVSFLLSGSRLGNLEEWSHTTTLALTAEEKDFLLASVAERERLGTIEAQRAAKERRLQQQAQQRLRYLLASTTIGFVVVAIFAIVAFVQYQAAQRQSTRAQDEADNAGTQAAIAADARQIAQNEADNAGTQAAIAQQNAATATVAQGDAQQQANIAGTQAGIAEQNAATATFAQGDAQRQANIAGTQAAIAQQNAATATVAQGDAQQQANIAGTQAGIAEQNAATATVAQGDAQRQANIAGTQAALAQQNAATATIAQGQAQEQANNVATQVAIAQTQQSIAEQSAATATIAQGQAQEQANNVATQVAIAQTQQSIAEQNAATATIAQGQAQEQADRARSLALAASAQQLLTSNIPLALRLAMEANLVPNPSSQAQQVLIATVFDAPRLRLQDNSGINAVAIHPVQFMALSANQAGVLTLWDLTTGTALRTFLADVVAVNDVTFSPSGNFFLSADDAGNIILWDFNTRAIVRRFEGHEGAVNDVAFSADESRIVSGSEEGVVIIWNVADGTETRRFTYESRGLSRPVMSVDFRPDGAQIAASYADGVIRLWDIEDDNFDELGVETDTAQATVRFSSSDAVEVIQYGSIPGAADDAPPVWLLLSSGTRGEGIPRLWGNLDQEPETFISLPAHRGAVNGIVFSPDQALVLSGSTDFTLILSNAATGLAVRRFSAHTSPVTSVAFSPNGQYILSASNDGIMYLWDVNPSAQTLQYEYTGHTGAIGGVAFTPDGDFIISASSDGTIREWLVARQSSTAIPARIDLPLGTAPTYELVIALPNAPDSEGCILTNNTLVVGSADQFGVNQTALIELEQAETLQTYIETQPAAFVKALAFSPDSCQILWGGGYILTEDRRDLRVGLLTLWDTKSGEIIRRFDLQTSAAAEIGSNTAITAVDFSPNGDLAVSGSEDGTLLLWDVDTGQALGELVGHTSSIRSVSFSADGQFILSGANDTTMIMWRVVDRQILRRFTDHSAPVTSVAFSPDSRSAISGSEDGVMILWDTGTGQLLQRFRGHDGFVTSVAFSPDGQFALSGSSKGELFLWRIDTSQTLLAFACTERFIYEPTSTEREQYGSLPQPVCAINADTTPVPPD